MIAGQTGMSAIEVFFASSLYTAPYNHVSNVTKPHSTQLWIPSGDYI